MTNFDMIRETIAYQQLLERGKKRLTEGEYHKLVSDSVREAFDDIPGRFSGFNAAMGWWHNKRKLVTEALASDGIKVRFNDEFETQFKEWYDSQELPITNGPLAALKLYSEKREEFEKIYEEQNKC